MRAVSLPRFLQSLISARIGGLALVVLVALIALLAFGATIVAATEPAPSSDWFVPFRW